MKIIDALKKDCPMPVVLTKKELDLNILPINILVDNEIAVKNLEKLSKSYNVDFSYSKENDIYSVIFYTGSKPFIEKTTKNLSNFALFVTKNYIGTNNELGYKLFDMMLYSYIESENIPAYILLINEGVKSLVNPSTMEHLTILNDKKVQILSCGACLNYYNLQDKIKLGNTTNMFEIVSILNDFEKVITI